EKYQEGTQAVAKAVANATQQGAFSCIGGGDTGKAVRQLGYADKVSYVSTAGGALLTYIQDSDLPGLTSLVSGLY
ncbi:MAG: phosphoglycerate kinase, partial [Bacteroidota bacterium]